MKENDIKLENFDDDQENREFSDEMNSQMNDNDNDH